ncbi:unnamed protein product [Rhizophagus irregularis]|nr:unnamed protein product [Rhizophagus irregularis]
MSSESGGTSNLFALPGPSRIPPMVTKVLHKTEQANIDHQPERGSSCNTGPTVKIYLHVKSQPSRKKFKESKWT